MSFTGSRGSLLKPTHPIGMPGVLRTDKTAAPSIRMTMIHVLIIEDDENLALGLSLNLKVEGYVVEVAQCGRHAMLMLSQQHWDLIILDLLLPDLHGMEILKRIRSDHSDSRVIVLSGVVDDDTRVAAFRSGADDYITKPFSLPDLLQRVRVRLLGSTNHGQSSPIEVDARRHLVRCYGQPVHLTRKEFDLLCCLVRADGRVLSVKELLRELWSLPATVETRTADYHIQSLRKKLRDAGLRGAIHRVYGRGVAWRLGNCLIDDSSA